jgi:hypothetical protein
MRLWSLHPRYLDAKGLVALWREGLLAQKVLMGETRGYRNHPQLVRFRASPNPLGAIASYLRAVAVEADERGYRFDRSRIARHSSRGHIPVTAGQVGYEFQHLLAKLKVRDPDRYRSLKGMKQIRLHPMFRRRKGAVESWEMLPPGRARRGEK